MRTTRAHLESHGRPVAYYSDGYSAFRVNRRDCEGEPTQFARALRTLAVESIHASSPQAKGRVERANRTLQDPSGEGDAAARDLRHGGGQRLPAGIHGGLQRTTGVSPWHRAPADSHREVLHDGRELDLIRVSV